MGGSGLVVSNRGVGDPMIKAFARLILWLAIALVLATAVLVWAFLPRHIPEAVACTLTTDPRASFFREPRSIGLVLNDCLLSPTMAQEIRGWYDSQPFSPASELAEFPRWTAGNFSFSVHRDLTLEPAGLHRELGTADGADAMRTAILSQTRYTFSW